LKPLASLKLWRSGYIAGSEEYSTALAPVGNQNPNLAGTSSATEYLTVQ